MIKKTETSAATYSPVSNPLQCNASSSFDAFREFALQRSRALYPVHETGFLILSLDQQSTADSTSALISEHRPIESRQYQVDLKRGESLVHELPVGGYTVVFRAGGFEPHRGFIEVTAQQSAAVNACIQQPAKKPPTLEERLEKYGLKIADIEGHDLTVTDCTSVTLDDTPRSGQNSRTLKIATIDDAKRILGNPDYLFPSGQPRYGKMVGPPSGQPPQRDKANLTADARFAMSEYIYGNSQSVIDWKNELNNSINRSALNFPVHLYVTVTVGQGAVLNVGAAGLFCDTLRVHLTGKVRVVGQGPTWIDTGIYEQFGINLNIFQNQVAINV